MCINSDMQQGCILSRGGVTKSCGAMTLVEGATVD